jgi:hypothetical protein
MASRGAIAARAGTAHARLQRAMARLSDQHGVELPPPSTFPYRQPELRVAADTERAAAFLEKLLGDEPAEYRTERKDPGQVTDQPAEEAEDGSGDNADEPSFAGQPLSWYDDKSDEEILSSPDVRVGEVTLKKIRKAQAKRDKSK